MKEIKILSSQHQIFVVEEDLILKIPKKNFLNRIYGIPSLEQARFYRNTIEKYFPSYFLPTEILSFDDSYAFMQKRIHNFEYLSISSKTKKNHFKKIFLANKKMLKETGLSLDFFGKYGFIKTIKSFFSNNYLITFSNIIIIDNKIIILDTMPFDFNKKNFIGRFSDKISYVISKKLIEIAFR